MSKVRLVGLMGCFVLLGLGCSSGSAPPETNAIAQSEALSGGVPLVGYWERLSGSFQFIEFTKRPVTSPDPNSYLFVARVEVNGVPVDLPGYYVEQSSTRVKLGQLGPVSAPLVRYFGIYATTLVATALDFRQQGVANPITGLLRSSSVKVGASALPTKIFLPAQTNAVDEFAAYELRKHLELVLGTQVKIQRESPLIQPGPDYEGIFLGNTEFARALKIFPGQFADEEYTVQSAGRSIVLAGKASLPAAAAANVHWGAPGQFAVQFDATKNEFAVEVAKNENLFSQDLGGTLELFLRDEAKCGPADRSQCTYGDGFLSLSPALALPPTFGVTLQHFDDGLHLTFGLRNDDRRDQNATYSYSPSPIVIPRDNQIHHVTIAFAPCTTAPTSAVCVTSWRDRDGAGTATPVWNNVALANSKRTNLDLSTSWEQRLRLNAHTGETGSMFLGSLYGLRFASRAATSDEHKLRSTASMLQTPLPNDTMVYPFSDGGGLPSDWAKPARRVVPPTPSMWGQRGTLNAAYEFLERAFGVRWYMPGSLGTTFTPQTSVSLVPMTLSLSNSMRHRYTAAPNWLTPPHGVAFGTLGEAFSQQDRDVWSLRMRIGGDDIPVGHGYNYFTGVLSSKGVQQPCYDDPSVIASTKASATKFYSVDQATYLASPEGINMPLARNGTFVMGAKDNRLFWGTGDCNYDSALARNRIDTTFPESQYFNGRASNYVWDLYNQVAAAAKAAATQAGRTSLVAGLAYLDYTYPPSQPIADNLLPVVTFAIRAWNSPNGRDIATAWKQKQPTVKWLGWTYVNDAGYGVYPTPPFDAAQLSVTTKDAIANGMWGLKFEENSSYDQVNAVGDLSTYATDIELYQAKPELWNNWPHSLSQLWQSISGTMHCDPANPTQGLTPDWTPYCVRYNTDPGATWARLAPLLVSAYVARGASYNMLENYVLLRTMADPTKSASTLLSEHFGPFYGQAGPALQSFYNAVAARPTQASFTECNSESPGSLAYFNCVWPKRFPKTFITQLAGYVNTARAKISNGQLTELETKRVNAFLRTQWCIFVRGRYTHYDDAAARQSSDP